MENQLNLFGNEEKVSKEFEKAKKEVKALRKEIGMTIESVDNIDVAYKLAQKYNVEMPIVNAVYDVLYNGLDPKTAVDNLMTRSLKEE